MAQLTAGGTMPLRDSNVTSIFVISMFFLLVFALLFVEFPPLAHLSTVLKPHGLYTVFTEWKNRPTTAVAHAPETPPLPAKKSSLASRLLCHA
jgi:hypothetical protein